MHKVWLQRALSVPHCKFIDCAHISLTLSRFLYCIKGAADVEETLDELFAETLKLAENVRRI